MVFSTEIKRELAWESQSIRERLQIQEQTPEQPQQPDAGSSVSTANIAAEWIEETPIETLSEVKTHLNNIEASVQSLHRIEQRNTWPGAVSLPAWVDEIDTIVKVITHTDPMHVHDFYKETSEVPFIHFTSSLITYARKELTDTPLAVIPLDCLTDAHEHLYHDLTGLLSEVLFAEFQTFKAFTAPTKIHTDPGDEGDSTDTEVYEKFIEKLHSEAGLRELFTEYPVLPRFISTRLTQWVEAIQEVDERLQNDWEDLAETFGFTPQDSVTNITVLPSDRHKNGRRVVKITTSSGVAFVYKPRSVKSNTVLDNAITTLAENSDVEYPEKSVLDKGVYGYVEHVTPERCSDEQRVETYYKRVGCVIAAAYMLQFTDCHYENIIADSDVPRIVDTETICAPVINTTPVTRAYTETPNELDAGVMKTGLLPQEYVSDEIPRDARMNGLSNPKAPVTGKHIEHDWEHVNTDYMALNGSKKDELHSVTPDNIPRTQDEVHTPDEYVSTIQQAFYTSTEPILSRREEFVNEITPEKPVPIRVILRPTRDYAAILDDFSTPETLQTGVNLTYTLDTALSQPVNKDSSRTHDGQQVRASERKQLLQLDVPVFTTTTHDTHIQQLKQESANEKCTSSEIITTTGIERVTETLTEIDASDIRKQNHFIGISCSEEKHVDSNVTSDSEHNGNTPVVTACAGTGTVQTQKAVTIAENIFTELMQESAEVNTGGVPTWLIKRAQDTGRVTITQSSNGLYDGRAGIGVFAAAVTALTNNTTAETTAVRIAEHIIETSKSEENYTHLGVSNGWFGKAYAVSVIGRLLSREDFIAESAEIVRRIPKKRIHDWDRVDVMSGVSGGVLTAAAIQRLTQSRELEEIIELLGDKLLSLQPEEAAHNVWKSDGFNTPVTGVAHGMTGIGYALEKAHTVTHHDRFCEKRDDAFKFAQNHYNEETLNWEDLREHTNTTHRPDAWCYGRSGITAVAARSDASVTPVPDTESVQKIIDNIDIVNNTSGDQLCCGGIGRAALLTSMYTTTNVAVDMSRVHTGVNTMIDACSDRGWFDVECHTDAVHNPSLFQGVPGIGYALLQITNPNLLPNPLLFE